MQWSKKNLAKNPLEIVQHSLVPWKSRKPAPLGKPGSLHGPGLSRKEAAHNLRMWKGTSPLGDDELQRHFLFRLMDVSTRDRPWVNERGDQGESP